MRRTLQQSSRLALRAGPSTRLHLRAAAAAAEPRPALAVVRAMSASMSTDNEVEDLINRRAESVKRELAILAEAFSRYDGDGNGSLDREEVMAALADLELPHGETDVEELFSSLDANHDGSIQLGEWLDNLPAGARMVVIDRYQDDYDSHRRIRFHVPMAKIVWTHTDEAPALASYSFLPIVRAFTRSSNVDIEKKDISVAGRILASFPDFLTPRQRQEDHLGQLGELAKTPAANIIKLPNVSASIPQLTGAIAELQDKGYAVPDYPADPQTDAERKIRDRYAKVLGSAVNPVLREGNSDRRVARPVKEFAANHPHKLKPWSPGSKTHVAHMDDGDFYSAEQSHVLTAPGAVRIEHVGSGGVTTVLKAKTALQAGEVIDASRMSVRELRAFFQREMDAAKEQDILFSLHLKATMMKVSDPIMFGHCVTVYFKDAFDKHADTLASVGANPNNGLADVLDKLSSLPDAQRAEIESDIAACYETGPKLAMVDSGRGITNLHAPNDVIIDASVPPAIRDGGKMWNKDDALEDVKITIPDRCYATMYQEMVTDCQEHGAYDVSSMGNVSNVGLMAQKAEEYGSHDKTFQAPADGLIRVVDNATGEIYTSHTVEQGDVWRMCQTKDSPIRDWVRLAVNRARATGAPAVFWLDERRAHDTSLIGKVQQYLEDEDTTGLDLHIMPPQDAMRFTLARVRQGEDTISVTGNVLRDYLTDLFPILELGTSAKMLSIVPLLAGGGLFETGAGGSAPKHVQQLTKENHLRWDSLGEFLALAVSLEDLAAKTNNAKAQILGTTLNTAIGRLLDNDQSPGRKVGQLDNRGSHVHLARHWADALAEQTDDAELAGEFTAVAENLAANLDTILGEIGSSAGEAVDLGGYFMPDPITAERAMRPSATLNDIITDLEQGSAEEMEIAM